VKYLGFLLVSSLILGCSRQHRTSQSKLAPEPEGTAEGWANVQKESTPVGATGKTFEVHMVNGTKGEAALSPGPPIRDDLAKKLRELPLRPMKYHLVCSKRCAVPLGGSRKCALDENLQIEIRDGPDSQIQALLVRKGATCANRRQPLSKGEFLVFGGDNPNSSCWLVLVKRVD